MERAKPLSQYNPMYYLYDIEIEILGRQIEEFVLHQRNLHSYLEQADPSSLIREEPETLAISFLKRRFPQREGFYLDGDIARLSKTITNNLITMDWANSLN